MWRWAAARPGPARPTSFRSAPASASTSPGPSRTRSSSPTPSSGRQPPAARPARYGDFTDICAAITGRVPNAGLHLTERRRGQLVFDVRALPDGLLDRDALYPLLGTLVGARGGRLVPGGGGLPAGVDEDRLKALGAAAASSGEVGLVHVVGSTPEAPTLAEALHHGRPLAVVQAPPA